MTEVPFHKPWLTMVDESLARAWSTMVDESLARVWSTMVGEKLGQSMGNHGWLRCHFTNHGWPWLIKAWSEHGQPWLTEVPFHKPWLTMVNESLAKASPTTLWQSLARAWSTVLWKSCQKYRWWPWSNVPWLTMVSHGAIHQKHGSHGGTMASQPGQVGQYPLWQLRIGTRFRCWHEIALCNLECNDYSMANFKVCRPASKWVSVLSPYFCKDIFSGVRFQKLFQCESEIT